MKHVMPIFPGELMHHSRAYIDATVLVSQKCDNSDFVASYCTPSAAFFQNTHCPWGAACKLQFSAGMNAPHDKLSGYVAYNPENKEIIVAFRGTVDPNWSMSGAFKNAMTDLDEEMIPFFKHAEILAHEGVLKGESLPRCPYMV